MAFTWITPTDITPATRDGSWQDVDLSELVPAGTVGVWLWVVGSNISGRELGLRKNGSTDDRRKDMVGHLGAPVGLDANRVFEASLESANIANVYLVGYWAADDAAFFDNGIELSVSVTTWTDQDISSYTGSDTAIAALVERGFAGSAFGVRCNGSTDEIYAGSWQCWAVVGVDENEVFELKRAYTSRHSYLVGYIKKGASFYVNTVDYSLATTGKYVPLAPLPEGATGGFFAVWAAHHSYSLRKKGTAGDIYKDTYDLCWFGVEGDADRLVEGKIESTDVDFFLTGYTMVTPQITSLTPDHGPVGTEVTIAGTSFGASQGTGGVTFNDIAASVISWSDTEVVVTVPTGATTGDVVLTNDIGGISNGVEFIVDQPAATLSSARHVSMNRPIGPIGRF